MVLCVKLCVQREKRKGERKNNLKDICVTDLKRFSYCGNLFRVPYLLVGPQFTVCPMSHGGHESAEKEESHSAYSVDNPESVLFK